MTHGVTPSGLPSDTTLSGNAPRDAGFWRRAVALLIDVCAVGTVVPLLFLLLVVLLPNFGRMFTLTTPFGLGIVERTIEDKSTETPTTDGSKLTTTDTTIERTVLGRWMYRYHIVGSGRATEGEFYSTKLGTYQRRQIDPVTGEDIETTDVEFIMFVVLMLYWILAESGRHQGSIGKRLLGLRVVDKMGGRLTFWAAVGRNLLKIISAVPVMIGFVMAAWTTRRQALHDMIAGSYVVVGER